MNGFLNLLCTAARKAVERPFHGGAHHVGQPDGQRGRFQQRHGGFERPQVVRVVGEHLSSASYRRKKPPTRPSVTFRVARRSSPSSAKLIFHTEISRPCWCRLPRCLMVYPCCRRGATVALTCLKSSSPMPANAGVPRLMKRW